MIRFVDTWKTFGLKRGYLDDGIISKKYRGKGIGTALQKEFMKWFKKKKAKIAVLDVSWVNHGPRKLYEKWGFRGF